MRRGFNRLLAATVPLILAPALAAAGTPAPAKHVSFALDEGASVDVYYNTMLESHALKYGRRLANKIWNELCNNKSRKPCYTPARYYEIKIYYNKRPHEPASCTADLGVNRGHPLPTHQGDHTSYADISCWVDGPFSVDQYCFDNDGGSFICREPF